MKRVNFKNFKDKFCILLFVIFVIFLINLFINNLNNIFPNIESLDNKTDLVYSGLPQSRKHFDKAQENPSFVMFYASWCKFCKKAAPHVTKLANNSDYNILAIDVDEKKELARQHKINSYPTFIYFPNGMKSKGEKYNGKNNYNSFKEYLDNKYNP